MTDAKEHLISWLRDAYAMEIQAVEICRRQSERIKNYPELASRIGHHADETEGQIKKLEQCFRILDKDPSSMKDAAGWMAGNMQAVAGMFMPDEIVKGSIASYVFEHLEIASYRVLIAAAQAAHEPEIAGLCQEILTEEEDMADWLEDHLGDTTAKFVARDRTNQTARI